MKASTKNPFLDVALLALKCGLSPLPPREDESKAPLADVPDGDGKTWKPYSTTPATREHVLRWYKRCRTGCGLATGYGGLECFEFDCRDTYDAFLDLAPEAGLGDLVNRIRTGYEEYTPSGGVHWLYRCDEVRGSTKLAMGPDPVPDNLDKKKTRIETKGDGGFVVIAPSSGKVHPTGKPYTLVSGGLETIATLTPEEREDLWEFARTFDEPAVAPTGETRPRSSHASDDGVRVGDDFNERATWADILEPFGWAKVFTRGDETYWRRPGKDKSWSARTGGKYSGMKVWSTSTSLSTEGTHSKFDVFVQLKHRGNWKAAVKDLVAQGYGTYIDAQGEERQNPRPAGNGKLSANGHGPPSASSDGQSCPPDDLPVILVTHKEFEVNNQAIAAMANDPELYQRNLKLVTVESEKTSEAEGIRRAEGTPLIRPVQPARLREDLTRVARWMKAKVTRDGEVEMVPTHPPDWSVAAVMARENWPNIRRLVGIIEAPTLRPDGSVIEKPGFDPVSGLLYIPNQAFPPVPVRPTQVDARDAARKLLSLVEDFPFKEGHEAAWLAALLTAMVRLLIDGPVPLFLFEANVSGAGKTLSCDTIGIIVTGRSMTRTGYAHDSIEMGKQITATALAGDQLVLFDNLKNGGMFGNSALDRALTGRTWRDRILGKSEMTPNLDLIAAFFASGNNTVLCSDVARRVVQIRLESPYERPEERTGFKIPDLLGYVARNRGELVAAVLTVIRAYVLAGKPPQNLTPVDFVAWSGLIRNAVYWSTGIDPCKDHHELADSNPDHGQSAALVEAWYELQLETGRKGFKVAEMLRVLAEDNDGLKHLSLRDALAELSSRTKPGELPSSGTIGMKIQTIRKGPPKLCLPVRIVRSCGD
jgi:hypothetical protein